MDNNRTNLVRLVASCECLIEILSPETLKKPQGRTLCKVISDVRNDFSGVMVSHYQDTKRRMKEAMRG